MESATIHKSLSTGSSAFCFPSEHKIPEGPEYEKYQHYIDARGEVLPTPHRNITAVVASNNFEKKNESFRKKVFHIEIISI